ncbi:MAG: alpha-ketoglutarate-dependent dioxygenase AlkB [Deltaproteobacteria bacterium]|nr:MAG: alpha-ketoglutarate-dependent dioxygenase AlkB [Deltaproteobacteria bacterium]
MIQNNFLGPHSSVILDDECHVRLISSFVSNPTSVFKELQEELLWRQDKITLYGKTHDVPRLQAWYADPGLTYTYSHIQLSPLPWYPLLIELKKQIEKHTNESFNSVLCNYYRTGNDYVAWHADDEKELGIQPTIASLSLGGARKFVLREKKKKTNKIELNLGSGDLLLMSGRTQEIFEHQIVKTKKEVEGRINLTFRRIIIS